jgi:branched-chain amino acid transport system substrate-binding protein
MAFAAQIFEQDINAAGGIKVGNVLHPIQIAKADDQCDPSQAQAAMNKLLTVDNVDFLVGGLCSNAVIAVLPTVARANRVFLVTDASSDTIWKTIAKNSWSTQFMFAPSEYAMNTIEAQFVSENLKPKTIALLSDDSDSGHDAQKGISDWLAANSPSTKILSADFLKLNAGDAMAELAKIKAEAPDVIFEQNTGVNSDAFWTQILDVNLHSIVISDAPEVGRADFVTAHSKGLEGQFGNIRWSPAYKTSLTQAFLDKFKSSAGRDADFFALQLYDGMLVLADAIQRAGTLDAQAVSKALESTNVTGTWGTHKLLSLADGHRGVWDIVIAQFRSGKPVVVYPASAAEGQIQLPTWYHPGQ